MAHAPDAHRAGTDRPRIGLFGGSFDPIHAGHLHAARAARDAFGLDRVVFVPAARSPFKREREPAPDADRLAMVRIAIEGEPGFEASDLELVRGGPSFTIDTVRALPRHLGVREDVPLYLILGSDQLEKLAGWRDARALFERVQPVVVVRDGAHEADLGALDLALGPRLGAKVRAGYLRLPPVEASSTDVRADLAGGSGDLANVSPRVLEYARAHRLYGAAP